MELRFKGGAKKRVKVRANTAIAHVGLGPEPAVYVTFAFFDADGKRVRPR